MKKLIENFASFYYSQDYISRALIDAIIMVGGFLAVCLLALFLTLILPL